jgi:hypothetical protein
VGSGKAGQRGAVRAAGRRRAGLVVGAEPLPQHLVEGGGRRGRGASPAWWWPAGRCWVEHAKLVDRRLKSQREVRVADTLVFSFLCC